MKRALFCVGLTLVVGTAFASRPDLNAFLNYRALSVPQLVRQVKTDAAVRDRYQRHFAMSGPEVVAYLQTLQLARLTQPGVYSVYSVPDAGFIKVHTQRLAMGTPVFADSFGTPTLIVKCGNPLTLGPKSPEAVNETNALMVDKHTEALRELSPDIDSLDMESLVALQPDLPTIPEAELVTINESPIPILVPVGFNLLPLLGLVGGGAIIGSIGHETSVPEPAAYAVLAVGILPLLRRRKP